MAGKRKGKLLPKSKNGTVMIAGVFFGLGIDMFYSSLGLPGATAKLPTCQQLTTGDLFQIMTTAGFTGIGLVMNSIGLATFAFGILLGGLIPKVLTTGFGLPRYGLFNFDPKSGGITPIARAGG